MKRHPVNSNLRIFEDQTFNNIPIQNRHGPLITNHLESMHQCFQRAINQYNRVSMMRFDLHLPEDCASSILLDNSVIERFFASLKAKITHAQLQSMGMGHRVHETEVRYVWGREVSSTGRVHYHIALLLNHDAYAHFGHFNLGNRNMYSRIHQAWASALHMCDKDVVGLIHIPANAIYSININEGATFNEAFYRASYLCKADTKQFQQKFHAFGCSRI